MRKRALFILGGLVLAVSIVMNVYQYKMAHVLGYISHSKINRVSVPDKIIWHGRTYWTEGESDNMLPIRWLGTATAGNEKINVFQEANIGTNKQIDYIMGERLVHAMHQPELAPH